MIDRHRSSPAVTETPVVTGGHQYGGITSVPSTCHRPVRPARPPGPGGTPRWLKRSPSTASSATALVTGHVVQSRVGGSHYCRHYSTLLVPSPHKSLRKSLKFAEKRMIFDKLVTERQASIVDVERGPGKSRGGWSGRYTGRQSHNLPKDLHAISRWMALVHQMHPTCLLLSSIPNHQYLPLCNKATMF